MSTLSKRLVDPKSIRELWEITPTCSPVKKLHCLKCFFAETHDIRDTCSVWYVYLKYWDPGELGARSLPQAIAQCRRAESVKCGNGPCVRRLLCAKDLE